MFRPRIAHQRLRKLLRQFPIVAIVGARQVGKSTLARFALKDFDYFDCMNNLRDQQRLRQDPLFGFPEFEKTRVG